MSQPRSGERIQPTAQAVGGKRYKRKPRKGRKNSHDTDSLGTAESVAGFGSRNRFDAIHSSLRLSARSSLKSFPHPDVHSSQTLTRPIQDNYAMNAELLARTLDEFLSEAAGAVVFEDAAVTFDLAQAKYSISGEHNKCLLHLWSAEQNTVRRVLEAEVKNGILRLAVQRLGQAHPTKLEICRERDRRSPSAKRAARVAYEHKLRRAVERHFPAFAITRLTTGVDLEKSFGPIYPGTPAAGSDRFRRSGSKRLRDPELDRCCTDFRCLVARRMPRVFCRKVSG